MPFLGAALAVLALVCVGHLLVTFALMRRLRAHEENHSSATSSVVVSDVGSLVGRSIPEFTAKTLAGEDLSRAALVGTPTVLGVFSSSCTPCHEQAVAFGNVADPARLAIVTARRIGGEEQQKMVEELGGTPRIVVEPESSNLAAALGITAFPTVLTIDEHGVIVGADHKLAELALAGDV